MSWPDDSFAYRPLDAEIDELLPALKAFRHDLHAHPELGYNEHRTAARVQAELESLAGFNLRTGVAGTGIVAMLGADLPGPAVALRADMDALPITEESGVPYSSRIPGVAHSCGHDGHTTMLLGAAKILAAHQDELTGPVKLIFQPAEEGGAGGQRMVEEGVLEDPPVAAVFGLHNMPVSATQAGEICLCPGAAMAGTGVFTITVRGKGGHAAAPHDCIDPVYIGSQVVNALHGIVARNTDPVVPAVVSVTEFHAGTAFNVIPEKAVLRGTLRALDEAVLEATKDCIVERAEAVARAYGASAEVEVSLEYPVLRNAERTDGLFREVVRAIGREADFREVPPIMGGEDFAFLSSVIPGTYWFLAARPADRPSVPYCHDPAFDFNDAVIADGVRVHAEIARRFARLWQEEST